MITGQIESIERCLPELIPLAVRHWEVLALDKDVIPLDVRWDWFVAQEKAGALVFATVRDSGKLVGYYIGVLSLHPHYWSSFECKLDSWRIVESHRGKNLERRLFRCVEKELKRRGVSRWWNGAKTHNSCARLYELLGFEESEVYYRKVLR